MQDKKSSIFFDVVILGLFIAFVFYIRSDDNLFIKLFDRAYIAMPLVVLSIFFLLGLFSVKSSFAHLKT
jgi:hypothetical protein